MDVTIHAPELDGATAWLNTPEPITLASLRGQLVILDFWTYCCINCMHVLPVLRSLEERHAGDPITVIGVHTAKFDAERDPGRIAQALARYDVRHPIAVDSERVIWSAYGVRSWPTLVVVRPDGTIGAIAPGEPDPDALEEFVTAELARAREQGTLADGPVAELAFAPSSSALRFPGKVLAAGGRVFVSDTGHHRVLVLSEDGRLLDTIGSGLRGARDGSFAEAAFDEPQGLALDGDELYIADTANHCLRVANLERREVETAAGMGVLGAAMPKYAVPATEVALRSPWDVAIRGRDVFIAMAGSHQIWRYDRDDCTVEVVAGSSAEALVDGVGLEATFAQPSGLALHEGALFVADSEGSAVRRLDLDSLEVTTWVGKGLFAFGDVDGDADTARLQHALGVTVHPDFGVLVADTYNNKVKRLDGKTVQTVWSSALAEIPLAEPGGLSVADDGRVWIADTNHHRLIVVDPIDEEARAVELVGVRAPAAAGVLVHDYGALPSDAATAALGWSVDAYGPRAVAEGRVHFGLEIEPAAGYELAADAPWTLHLEVRRRADLVEVPAVVEGRGTSLGFDAQLATGEETAIEVLADVMLCVSGDAARCVPVRLRTQLHVESGDGDNDVVFRVPTPSL